MHWIYDLPTPFFSLVLIIVMSTLACAGNYLVRRYVPRDVLVRHNEISGFVVGLVGVIYAVLLSFVVVVVWQEYDAASADVAKEESAAVSLYHIAYGFPEPTRSRVQVLVREYARLMIYDEWPAMRRGGESASSDKVAHQILHTILDFKGRNDADASTRDRAVENVQTFMDWRSQRLDANSLSMPAILWFTLLVGAIITISFTYFFGVQSAPIHYILLIGLTTLIATMFALILQLDLPFQGNTSVPPTPWERFYVDMQTGQDAPGH